MFKPNSAKDRINYGEVLLPPDGFSLQCAVGTTYSLDLETLTAISISLGLIEETDSDLLKNPICMLNALQKVSDKILVFCEAGQIKLPTKANALCLMLEKMIVPIALPYSNEVGIFPAFHPKTWLIEYSNADGEKKYKFVVLSRNLTFDHSWDVACALDGEAGDSEDDNPVLDFLLYLKRKLNKDLSNYERHGQMITRLISAINEVRFLADARFSECYILPLGIGDEAYDMPSNELFNENFHELIVMSPFLTGSVIAGFNKEEKTLTNTRRTLITRRSELSKIANGEASNFDVYVMKDSVVDGESAISEGTSEGSGRDAEESAKESTESAVYHQDIHAKVYLRRKNNVVDLYMGSMNASYAAINANVEMMLWLRTRGGVINGERFLDDIMGEDREGKNNPFVLVRPEDIEQSEETSAKDRVEHLIKRVCRINMKGGTTKNNDDTYELEISANIDMTVDGVKVRPLRSEKESSLIPQMVFSGLRELELSEFYVISASIDDCTLERVIMIPTAGIPGGRDEEIIRSVIKDKRSFIEYVSFILGEDYVQSFLENKMSKGDNSDWGMGAELPAVYEKMLKTSVSDPDRLKELQYITKAITDEDIIPKEFMDMYQVFCDTLRI